MRISLGSKKKRPLALFFRKGLNANLSFLNQKMRKYHVEFPFIKVKKQGSVFFGCFDFFLIHRNERLYTCSLLKNLINIKRKY